MRKDFLVDTVQVREAKAAGASGILLIAAILSDDELANMLDCAFDNDLFVLLESFDETDLERSARMLQKAKIREQAARTKFLIGVNARNLQTLALDPCDSNDSDHCCPMVSSVLLKAGSIMQRMPLMSLRGDMQWRWSAQH
jgi:indole-3-glycerol phosphate synthase